MKARWIPEAIGATVLLLFPMMVLVITPGYLFVYHHRRPLTPVLNGLMLDLLGLAVTGVLALALLPRLPQLWRRIIAGYLTGLFLWVFAFDAIILLRDPIGGSPLPHHAAVALMVQTWWSRWNHRLVVALPLLIAAGAWLKQGLVRPIVRVNTARSGCGSGMCCVDRAGAFVSGFPRTRSELGSGFACDSAGN